jgi:hypothetical protein
VIELPVHEVAPRDIVAARVALDETMTVGGQGRDRRLVAVSHREGTIIEVVEDVRLGEIPTIRTLDRQRCAKGPYQ